MNRSWFAILLALLTAQPAGAKLICPPGRFVLQVDPSSRMAAFDGRELELGQGRASLPGLCTSARAGRFLAHISRGGMWLNKVRTRRLRCDAGLSDRVRSRSSPTGSLCTRLEGVLRLRGGRRVAFAADRIPACGNGIRELGEECDGTDSAAWGTCCTDDCTVKPGCPMQCDRTRFLCTGP